MKKLLLALVVFGLMVTPAIAGNQPEFDAVGCDASNFFNDFIKIAVCEQGDVFVGGTLGTIRINEFSNFQLNRAGFFNNYNETFRTQAGMLLPDPCFTGISPTCLVQSALTDPFNEGIYTWVIVLQKKPESDLNINIRDCVLKHNTFDVWTNCEQTGRYRAPWGQLFFVETANPQITVRAYPGQFATPGFPAAGFGLDARQIPGLDLVALEDAVYTSKCLWEESIIVALPTTGGTSVLGEAQYNLKQGDIIQIQVYVPGNNSVDIFYGPENVSIKYIGIVGTEFVTATPCGVCGACTPVLVP